MFSEGLYTYLPRLANDPEGNAESLIILGSKAKHMYLVISLSTKATAVRRVNIQSWLLLASTSLHPMLFQEIISSFSRTYPIEGKMHDISKMYEKKVGIPWGSCR